MPESPLFAGTQEPIGVGVQDKIFTSVFGGTHASTNRLNKSLRGEIGEVLWIGLVAGTHDRGAFVDEWYFGDDLKFAIGKRKIIPGGGGGSDEDAGGRH